jgi:hypothetical protein
MGPECMLSGHAASLRNANGESCRLHGIGSTDTNLEDWRDPYCDDRLASLLIYSGRNCAVALRDLGCISSPGDSP